MQSPGHPSDGAPTNPLACLSHEGEDAVMDFLTEFSAALSSRTAKAAPNLVALTFEGRRSQRSGFLWQPGVLVTSEQGLPDGPAQAILPGGVSAAATPAGRDSGTNIAVFRLETTGPAPDWTHAATPAAGALALLLGADGTGGAAARLGLINRVGPAWTSMAGGRIDRLIWLDARLAASEEGGPVLDAAGGLLGMSTLGPRRRTLVIPAETLARVVGPLLSAGRVARGWLGVSLHAVAVPPALQADAGATVGLMLMSLAEGGPGEKAGLLPGDIFLTLDGVATEHPRATALALAALPAGQTVTLRLLRGGVVQSTDVIIGERPSC
jgi:S1-C subfamily serine protease